MPHPYLTDIHMLDESIRSIQQSQKGKHIILAGDFNYPDIEWKNAFVRKGAADREVQQILFDLSTKHDLIQTQDQPTRQQLIRPGPNKYSIPCENFHHSTRHV